MSIDQQDIPSPSSATKLLSRVAIRPMLNTWLRQKYSVAVMILQIAITLAVISNGLFVVVERLTLLQQPSGLDENNTFVLTSSGFTESFNPKTSIQTDLAELRAMPNIVNAVTSDAFPYSGSSTWVELQTVAGDNQNLVPAATYKLDEHGIQALGLTLLAGENFSAAEVIWQKESELTLPQSIIVTQRLAESLFNTQDWTTVVGKTVYLKGQFPAVIKGIVKQLQTPWDYEGITQNSVIYPRVMLNNSARYLIRTQPNSLDSSMADIEQFLGMSNKQRMLRKVSKFTDIKKQILGPDIAAVTILLVVICVLSGIVLLGIAGMASFNVVKRRRQIGVRRALGATKTDIVGYFLLENVIQTTFAILIGCALALILNILLVEYYALSRLPISYMLLAGCCLYVLGLVATLKPALKAMNISPAEATRSL